MSGFSSLHCNWDLQIICFHNVAHRLPVIKYYRDLKAYGPLTRRKNRKVPLNSSEQRFQLQC